jgi:raffinose/stachyose/melibiose transport system permease protein
MAAPTLSVKKALLEWKLYLFILPSAILIGTFSYFPVTSAIYHSFFDWQGGDIKEFVGLNNFRRIFTDTTLWNSFITVFILIIANFFKMIPSITIAVVIHRLKSDKWQYFYRVLLVLPMIVPGLVTLFIWKFFFDPNLGVLNNILDFTGGKQALIWLDQALLHWNVFREGIPIPWLGEPRLILPAVILWGFPWLGAVGVLIYLAGLQSIGTEVYEAADLDGVSAFQKFWHIELPLITTQIRLNVILMVISTLQGYGQLYLLLNENGGAGGRGMVPGLWMFNRAFVNGEFGYACSIGLILFIFILTLTYINNKYIRVDK